MLNPSAAPVTIRHGERVAVFHPIEEACVVSESSTCVPAHSPEAETKAVKAILAKVDGISQTQRESLRILLSDYVDILSLLESDLGRTTIARHGIDTGDATPVKQPARSMPFTICAGR